MINVSRIAEPSNALRIAACWDLPNAGQHLSENTDWRVEDEVSKTPHILLYHEIHIKQVWHSSAKRLPTQWLKLWSRVLGSYFCLTTSGARKPSLEARWLSQACTWNSNDPKPQNLLVPNIKQIIPVSYSRSILIWYVQVAVDHIFWTNHIPFHETLSFSGFSPSSSSPFSPHCRHRLPPHSYRTHLFLPHIWSMSFFRFMNHFQPNMQNVVMYCRVRSGRTPRQLLLISVAAVAILLQWVLRCVFFCHSCQQSVFSMPLLL